jgi:N-acetylmuramoyl-L-alanine amidase
MLPRLLAAMLAAFALLSPVAATDPDLTRVARAAGTPTIPGLKMVWLAPWGDVASAHPWRNIIVHQTEGPAGSARGGAQAQSKNPTRRGVTVWVETDGTVYWSVAENLVPTHGDGANRNDNAFIDNSATYRQVVRDNSIGVEFAGNFPDVTTGPTEAQVAAWHILVRVLRARYAIPLDHVYAHNWIDSRTRAIAKAAGSRRWQGCGASRGDSDSSCASGQPAAETAGAGRQSRAAAVDFP